jgi:hypothetical protein
MLYFKNKTFEKIALEAQQVFESHDYKIRMAPKTFFSKTVFIAWFEAMFFV